MHPKRMLLVLMFIVCVLILANESYLHAKGRVKSKPRYKSPVIDSLIVNGYKFKWGYPPSRKLRLPYVKKLFIYYRDSLIDSLHYWNFGYGVHPVFEEGVPVAVFDLDYDGFDELLMRNYLGGATGCCEVLHIFEIFPKRKRKEFKPDASLMGWAPMILDIRDYDCDNAPEIKIRNGAFINYDASYTACMPYFTSYLKYWNGKFIDVTRRFKHLLSMELDSVKREFFKWKKEHMDEIGKPQGRLGGFPSEHDERHGWAVALYIRYSLLGRKEEGRRFIEKELPRIYKDWFKSRQAEIDSILGHWLEEWSGEDRVPLYPLEE